MQSLICACISGGKVDGHSDSDDDAFDDLLPHRAMPMNCKPYWITVKINTPLTMPPTLPIPPFNDTPLTTHAAMALSSTVAVVVRCACGSGCFRTPPTPYMKEARMKMQHDGLEYVDAGNDSRFTVAADRVNVLAKDGLIQDKPNGNGKEDSDRDQKSKFFKQFGSGRCAEVWTHTADRGSCSEAYRNRGTCAVDHNLHCQGRNKTDECHTLQPGIRSMRRTACRRGLPQQSAGNRQLREFGIETVRIGSRLEHGGGNNCRQADHTACGHGPASNDQEAKQIPRAMISLVEDCVRYPG